MIEARRIGKVFQTSNPAAIASDSPVKAGGQRCVETNVPWGLCQITCSIPADACAGDGCQSPGRCWAPGKIHPACRRQSWVFRKLVLDRFILAFDTQNNFRFETARHCSSAHLRE